MGMHRGRRRAPRRRVAGATTTRASPGPLAVGAATLAVVFGGAASSAPSSAQPAPDETTLERAVLPPTALGGSSGGGRVDRLERRAATVSRDSSRQALAESSKRALVAAAEKQARQRNVALARNARRAEQQAAKIVRNQWSLPMASYRLTAEFGDHGLWASSHTGLDFAAPSGAGIAAVAAGEVTAAGYDGAYGNKTVVTLEDGTEVWYCHQTSFGVSVGDDVSPGEGIGTVGSTGNVTGPHLHLEVRPGGGDPVDPYAALKVHGLQP